MPRLLMKKIFFLLLLIASSSVFGQVKIWSNFGDEALREGDYYGASRFFLKAWDEDSTYEGLIYKLGMSFKGYHNNEKALFYFQKIENSKALQIKHPDYLFHLAQLYKGLGKYELSRDYFEKFSRIKNDFTSYQYLKAKNELIIHDKIVGILRDTSDFIIQNIIGNVNTGVAEYYPVWINDSTILYSSLKASNVSPDGVINDQFYSVNLYSGHKDDSIWNVGNIVTSNELLGESYSDGSFDKNGEFYFSRQLENLNYELVKAKFLTEEILLEKNAIKYKFKLGVIEPVFENLNNRKYNFRNPFVFNSEGVKYLLFSSNKPGGSGKMDLWYSENREGKWGNPKNLGSTVNSPGDEIGPNYNLNSNRFYFSSNWHYGLGGFDLFEAVGPWKKPTDVLNMGIPFNSSFNDLYIAPYDSIRGLFTSSRIGSKTTKDAVCCNDLYEFRAALPEVDSALVEITDFLSRDSIMKRLQRLVEEFHVTLYFHNDRPNPDSWDTTTQYSYLETYEAYMDSISTYYERNTFEKSGQDSIDAFNKINDFFDEYVHEGVRDLRIFSKELLKELEFGSKILLTVKGYASPLAESDYNVNLTQRRISSLENYLRSYPKDAFSKYLDGTSENGGRLFIKKVPFGEFKSDSLVSDNYFDTKKSIYSKEASLERRVEIINLSLFEEDSMQQPNLLIDLDSSSTVFNLGLLDTSVFQWSFQLENKSDKEIRIIDVDAGCNCLQPKSKFVKVLPGESKELEVDFDLSKYKGKLGRKIELTLDDGAKKSIILLMELQGE